MKIDIFIPTYRPQNKVKNILKSIMDTVSNDYNVKATCFNVSAATNRNWCLNHSDSNCMIMCDDDIVGYFHGWADLLIESLYSNKDVVMVSARLMRSFNKIGVMMNIRPDLSKDVVCVPDRMLPSACIAFKKNTIRFDESYKGGGFEDTDYCMQLNNQKSDGIYLIDNRVKLIHKNEQKFQMTGQLLENQQYFKRKWNIID